MTSRSWSRIQEIVGFPTPGCFKDTHHWKKYPKLLTPLANFFHIKKLKFLEPLEILVKSSNLMYNKNSKKSIQHFFSKFS